MGKSEKKAKSDKINLLKKQYDAFLEEDKRRKDRNETILKKLDKMRVCDKLVPYTTKVQYLPEVCLTQPYNRYETNLEPTKEYQICQPQSRPSIHTLGVPIQTIDKTLLKEISKAYILIPKLRQAEPVSLLERTKSNTRDIDDSDWKSKYDILKELKQSEKEELSRSDVIVTNEVNDKDALYQANDDFTLAEKGKILERDSIISESTDLIISQNVSNTNPTESKNLATANLKYTQENNQSSENEHLELNSEHLGTYSQEALSRDIQNIEVARNVDYNQEQDSYNLIESNKTENEDHVSLAPHTEVDNENVFIQDSDPQTMQTTFDSAQYYVEPAHNTVSPNDDGNIKIAQVAQVGVIKDSELNSEGHYAQENDLSPYNYQIDDSKVTQEVNFNNNDSNFLHSTISNEAHENFVVQTTQNENIEELKSDQISNSGHQDQIEDVTNVNAVYEEYPQSNECVDNTVIADHQAAIEDFETEQTNMFYTDPAQQSQHGEGNVYDQSQENQDGNYLQDEQYNAHYDAVLSDQVYNVEVNDDEQVLHSYDQTYEQQYVGEDGQAPVVGEYDPTAYTHQQQPYDGQNDFENPQHQQLYEGQQQYEGEQYEVQQGTQPFEQHYEQTPTLPSEEMLRNDNYDSEQNIEKQLDKDEGLQQTQPSELQPPINE